MPRLRMTRTDLKDSVYIEPDLVMRDSDIECKYLVWLARSGRHGGPGHHSTLVNEVKKMKCFFLLQNN